jgi:hypothetical protein
MLLSKRPDGSLLIECRADQFTEAWKAALQTERVVLQDGRPAVRRANTLGITFTTIHPHAWEILRKLPRNRPKVANKIRLCEWCGYTLKVSREYEDVWCFTCDRCRSSEVHSKLLVGGTIGAGEREKDQPRR